MKLAYVKTLQVFKKTHLGEVGYLCMGDSYRWFSTLEASKLMVFKVWFLCLNLKVINGQISVKLRLMHIDGDYVNVNGLDFSKVSPTTQITRVRLRTKWIAIRTS